MCALSGKSSRYEVDTEALAGLTEALARLTQTCIDARKSRTSSHGAEAK